MTDYVPSHKTAGQGPAVLFLHGLGGNRHAFDRQFAALTGDFTCIAWDLPGYGGSEPLPSLDFPTLAQCVDNLVKELNVTPYAVVGHSIGGMIIQSWLRRGGACERVVLAQTSASFGKPGSQWNEDFLSARLTPINNGQTPADFAKELITNLFHDTAKADAIEEGVATMATLPADVYRQAIECLVTFNEREHLASIQQPTLCLAGEYDATAPPKTMQQMAAQIPDGRYQCLAGIGHLGYIEDPDAFSRALHQFLTA